MPLYEYECAACGQHFELIRRFSEPDVDVCAVCGKGPVQRLLSSPAIQFKGSGWYVTDYARKAKSEKAPGEKSADGKSDASEKKTDGASKSDAASTPTSASSTETKP